jgi:hypothetical protein
MHHKTHPSHIGNSTSQGTPTDNHSTHHQDHRQDTLQKEVEAVEAVEVEVVEVEVVEVEVVGADYLHHIVDQACFPNTEMHQTLTNSWAANQSPSQGTE